MIRWPRPALSISHCLVASLRPVLTMEGTSKGLGRDPLEIRRRELGVYQPRVFARRVGGHEAFVKRLDLYGKLNGHRGCVNTIHFNPTGDLIVSGSDDKHVILWNWAAKSKILAYHSGHVDNVFQAQVMPFTDDRTIVTAAADGQVRIGQIAENGEVNTKRLGKHRGRVHKLAVEPGSPYIFYSCGEDGFVQHFDLRSHSATKLLMCSSFSGSKQPIQLNSIVIDPRNPNYFAVGGYDEYARVYDVRISQWDTSNSDQPLNTFSPHHLIGSDNAHITGLAYSNTSELLVSYNDELVYLFQKDMGIGSNPLSVSVENLRNRDQPQVYSGHRNSQTIKGVSFFGPNDEYVASGSDCGHAFIWKKKGGELICLLVGDRHVVNCIEPHPFFPFLATSGLDKNIKLWAPIAKKLAPLPKNAKEIMEANKRAREDRARITLPPDVIMHVLRLQRRQPAAYVERRTSDAGIESDEDEGEAIILGFSQSDASSEEGLTEDPRECIIF